MNSRIFLVISAFLLMAGCSPVVTDPSSIELTIDDYMMAAPNVKLDMTKSEVMDILQPTQVRLDRTEIKQPDMYKKDGVLVEILYFRSGLQADGLTTDDEFTPYLFNDGKLVAVGWAVLGGAKSHGQARQTTNVHTTTILRQGMIIY